MISEKISKVSLCKSYYIRKKKDKNKFKVLFIFKFYY